MNIQKMMAQAQAMQSKLQDELAAMRIEATAGGGMVKIDDVRDQGGPRRSRSTRPPSIPRTSRRSRT